MVDWKAVKALFGVTVAGTLVSYLAISFIKNPDEAGATTMGVSMGMVGAIIYDLAKGE